MTVKDIFDLRKQGRIEEAYEAIRPIYREHKGRFTTLCMFWVASDVFKLRLEQGRVEEATKIYEAMKRILPSVEDDEQAAECEKARPEVKHSAAKFMHYAEGRLIKASEKFRKRYFAMKKRKGQDLSTPPLTPPLIGAGNTEGINNPSDIPSELNAGQQAVLECVKANPGLKVPEVEAETGIPAKSVERHVKVLVERGFIEHRGSKKTGGYHAL